MNQTAALTQIAALAEAEQVRASAPRDFADVRQRLDQIEGREAGAKPQGASAAAVTANVTTGTPKRTRKGRSTQQMTDTQQATPSNVPSIDQYLAEAEELGKLAGQGKNTGVTMLLKMLEGGYLNALTVDPRQGETEGDHAKLAAKYASAQGLTNMFDAKASNIKKLRSDFKTAIKTGSNPKWGTGQPVAITNSLMAKWKGLRNKRTEGLVDAYNMVLKFWRQIGRMDVLPDDDELDAFCFKPEARTLNAERVLESLRRTATRLSQGKLTNCPDQDDSPEVKAIISACTKRLTQIAKGKKGQTQQAAA